MYILKEKKKIIFRGTTTKGVEFVLRKNTKYKYYFNNELLFSFKPKVDTHIVFNNHEFLFYLITCP